MGAILRVRTEDGSIIEVPAIKGEKGDKGDTGEVDTSNFYTKAEIDALIPSSNSSSVVVVAGEVQVAHSDGSTKLKKYETSDEALNNPPTATIPIPEGYNRDECRYAIWTNFDFTYIARYNTLTSLKQSVEQSTGIVSFWDIRVSSNQYASYCATVPYLCICVKK